MADSNQQTANQAEQQSKISQDERNLTVSFIQFLRQKVSANELSGNQADGIELVVQTLENVFNLTDKSYAFQPGNPLIEMFKATEGGAKTEDEFPKPTEADIELANKLKEEGNKLVGESKFNEAVEKYNKAIKLNRDPVYFCNRAAAFCRLDKNDLAIQDCRTALALDPNYAKAYGRMGVALSFQKRHDEAIEAYRRAIELDPANESYKSNLAIAEEKLRDANNSQATNNATGGAGGFPFGGLGGLGNIFNDPQMQQMASQMMSDPNIQNMMGQMMGAFTGAAQQTGAASNAGGGLENLLRAGEQLAQALNQQNPELVDQFRQQFANAQNPDNEQDPTDDQNGDNQPPPPSQ